MAKKLIAVFLMCLFLIATVDVHKAEANDAEFKECCNTATRSAHGFTFCEMKYDNDCSVKE
ncbi:Hypothetical predicted protein, partial [Olea europaea subsp. europaea]